MIQSFGCPTSFGPMLPDLYTLLLVRMGFDGLIALAFLRQMRRYPGIGGPGWWCSGG